MSEQSTQNGIPDLSLGERAGRDGREHLDLLEDRVRRLEDVVAGLQDTRPLEDRVVEKLAARTATAVTMVPTPVPRERTERSERSGRAPSAAQLIIEAGRHLLPAPGREGDTSGEKKDEGRAAGAAPEQTPWLPYELYADARATLRMYLDPRYRMSWWGRVLPPVLLAMIVTSWFWVPFATLLWSITATGGALLIKAVDVVLAYLLFKVLQPEVRRYRRTSPDLPSSLRL